MRFYWLGVATLCVWRVTHLLNAEDGPGDILVGLRRMAGQGFWGNLLDCFYCLSLWVAVPFALLIGQDLKERALLWLALSGGAILLERGTTRETPVPAYFTTGEQHDAMLRESEKPDTDHDGRAPG